MRRASPLRAAFSSASRRPLPLSAAREGPVAPRWQGGDRGEPESLASAYRTSLEVAEQEGDRTIAFPSLGTGIYGNPLAPSARIALRTVAEYLRGPTQIVDIVLILFSEGDLRVYAEALGEVLSE